MKKVLVTFVLALAGAALAYGDSQAGATTPSQATQPQAAQPSSSPAAGTQGASTPANQKVIKDPAEYNAYMAALNAQDPAQRASAMDAFVKQYPQSVMLIDALEQEMAAYQAAQNQAQVEATAKRILQLAPDHIRALAIVVAIDRAKAGGGDQAALKESCTNAQTGLQKLPSWQKPENVSDAEFQKVKSQMLAIFNDASANCALQAHDWANARTAYEKAIQLDPTNWQNFYFLAVSSLELNPIDIKGLWYCARAINLAQQNAASKGSVPQMTTYCRAKYRKYHGNYDGWDQMVANAATQNALPADFTVAAAPTPPELACKAIQENDPAQLSPSDWEYILQYRDSGAQCNKDAADKVWAAIQAKQKDDKGDPAKLKLTVKVISATADTVDAAMTDENQQAGKADLHIAMTKPMAKIPAAGSTLTVIGTISDYTPSPFMFTMTGGELPAAARPPARKGTVRKKG